ncbi:MAG: hypothetical protein RL748_429 [Pseudomonadota bacterium]
MCNFKMGGIQPPASTRPLHAGLAAMPRTVNRLTGKKVSLMRRRKTRAGKIFFVISVAQVHRKFSVLQQFFRTDNVYIEAGVLGK